MKILRRISQSLVFSALILATNCTSDGTQSDEDGFEAADAGNQVVEIQKDEVNDSEIPNPEQVAIDAAQSAEAAGEAIDSNSPNVIQDLASEQQAGQQGPQLSADSGEDDPNAYRMNKDQKMATPVSDAEADRPSTDSLPSLSQVVAESDSAVQQPTAEDAPVKSPKAKSNKSKKSKPTSVAASDSTLDSSAADEYAPAKPKKARSHKSNSPRAADTSDGEALSGTFYIVQPGDTLGQISTLIYGTSRRWQDLATANKLSSDSHIFPGDVIRYQGDEASAGFEAKYNGLTRSKIVVQKADTLSLIAERNLGNKAYWKLLWRWNAAIVAKPDQIFEGQSLEFIAPEELSALLSESKGLKSAH